MKINTYLTGILLASFSLLLSNQNAIAASDLICAGTVESGTFANVYVNPGTSCTLAGTGEGGLIVEGSVFSDGAENIVIGSPRVAFAPAAPQFEQASVIIKGSVNIKGTVSDTRINPGATIRGDLTITENQPNSAIVIEPYSYSGPRLADNNKKAKGKPTEVQVDAQIQIDGNLTINNNLASRIVILFPTIGGSASIISNTLQGDYPDPNFPNDLLLVLLGSVGGDAKIAGNTYNLIDGADDNEFVGIEINVGSAAGSLSYENNSSNGKFQVIGWGSVKEQANLLNNTSDGSLIFYSYGDPSVDGDLELSWNTVNDGTTLVAEGLGELPGLQLLSFSATMASGNGNAEGNTVVDGFPFILQGHFGGNLLCKKNTPNPSGGATAEKGGNCND